MLPLHYSAMGGFAAGTWYSVLSTHLEEGDGVEPSPPAQEPPIDAPGGESQTMGSRSKTERATQATTESSTANSRRTPSITEEGDGVEPSALKLARFSRPVERHRSPPSVGPQGVEPLAPLRPVDRAPENDAATPPGDSKHNPNG